MTKRASLSLLLSALLILAPASLAQSTQPIGLDSLNDDRLISELANMGLGDLLERAFEVNHIPEPRRVGIRAMVALRELGEDTKLNGVERRELLAKITSGIEQAIQSLDDPQVIMQQATLLIRQGVERDVNTLEYWGENPQTQKELEPVVRAVIKLLEKCETVARKQADDLGNQLTGPADPRGKVWEELNALSNNAAYTRNMVLYDLALCLGSNSDERAAVTQKAMDYLKQFDNPQSTVQPVVRIQLAKLHMLRDEIDPAEALFASVAAVKGITPPPDARQQYEARYFSAVCDLIAGDEPSARQKLDELVKWQATNLPKDPQTQAGADAAIAMLRYRLTNLRASKETDPAAKSAAIAEGRDLLLSLVQRRPDLRGIVLEQLLSKLPLDTDLKKLDPLFLEAILQRADAERLKPESEKVDANVLKLGLAAAKELLSRPRQASIDAHAIDAASLLVPLLEERLGRLVEAADGYLDYITGIGAGGKSANLALDAAQSVIARLRADPARAGAADVVKVYERFLPIAINPPFLRRNLAYEYGRLLQQQQKFSQAAASYAQVLPNDPRIATARFYQIVCTCQQLDDPKLDRASRNKLITNFSLLSQQVNALATNSLDAAKSDAEKTRWRAILVRTALLSADVARREENDPQRTLSLLSNIEQQAKGLAGEQNLLASALYTRVQAYMALGQSDQATQSLVKLLETRNGGEGVAIVYDLMQRLNHDLDEAQLRNDKSRMAAIAKNRAQLSGFLVKWAQESKDPNIHKYAYRYAVFDAATRHLAADLEEDPVNRAVALRSALALYQKLETPEAVAMYRATLDPKSGVNPNDPDPQVSLGIGLVSYDLADYAEAQKRLGELLIGRKLGSPQETIEENGIERIVDNDEYWEATLKLLRSNLALAAQHVDASSIELRKQTQNHLKQLYIEWGNGVGGKKWHDAFEALRLEIIPGFTDGS